MDEIHIPNDATYAPFSLTDVIATAPLASRLLLGATLPGRVLSAAAFGMYAGSALKDWYHRLDVTWIDFEAEPNDILAYAEKSYPSSLLDDGYVVLRFDGTAEWMAKEEFEELLAQQQSDVEIEMTRK